MHKILTILLLCCASIKSFGDDTPADTYRLLNMLSEAFRTIRSESATPLSDEKLIEAAMEGMLSSVDPFSHYISPEHYKNMMTDMKGELEGVGIELMKKEGHTIIITPLEGSPAWTAGLKAGDHLLEINTQKTRGLSLYEIGNLIRGDKGESVSLKIQRPSTGDTLSLTLKREKILLENVRWEMRDNIAYIRIANFHSKTTAQHLKQALEKIIAAHPQGLLIDLRNNPGGLFEEVLTCLNYFIQEGVLVSVQPRKQNKTKPHHADAETLVPSLPMVILINKGTASCAEIMAGCLQDHRRALILGTSSFGKGTVQSILPLSPGYAAISLTTAQYLTPSGKNIDGIGINPDVVLEQDDSRSQDLQRDEAFKLLRTRGVTGLS